ncbi:tetratricopeptide repeat protein [Streptomyces sp. NPDC006529]|uniref:tetratricopeptide repeat protein n=1 Tax=Streptomyces sp. NPDC006529 TaxID=3157177 RepID=UPI0033B62677
MTAEPPRADPVDDGGLDRADALHDLGRFAQAAALAGARLAQHPDDARALILLARCRRSLGDLPGALACVDDALRVAPDDTYAWLVRVDTLVRLGRFAEAEEAAHRCIALSPHFWGGHHCLAVVLEQSRQRGRRHEAYLAARRATELEPQAASAHFMVGLLAHRLGDRATARLAYETTLRLDPENSEAHNNLATLDMRRSWFSRAAWTRAAEGFVASAALDVEDRHARFNLEAMAWGIAAGGRWPALLGFVVSLVGRAPQSAGGGARAAATVTGAVLLLALWSGWALWQRGKLSPRLRRPLLLTARGCPPVVAMAVAVAVMAAYSVVVMALPSLGAGVVGALAVPLFWGLILTYWISRAALNRRSPDRRGR